MAGGTVLIFGRGPEIPNAFLPLFRTVWARRFTSGSFSRMIATTTKMPSSLTRASS